MMKSQEQNVIANQAMDVPKNNDILYTCNLYTYKCLIVYNQLIGITYSCSAQC